MSFGALCAVLVAATPDAVSVGSVDGPFAWVDVRVSVDDTALGSSASTGAPLSGQFASGRSGLVQEQLFAGWGLRVLDHRLVMGLSLSATEVLTDPYTQNFPSRHPRFDGTLQVVTAMPLLIDRLTVVPVLGVTLPTKDAFGTEPIVGIEPQLRIRAASEGLLVGGSLFVHVPAINTWASPSGGAGPRAVPFGGNRSLRECPREASRCRMPVARELWVAGVSLQVEYWFRRDLSLGAVLAFEARDENLAALVISSAAADATVISPGWSLLETRGRAFVTWAPFDHLGLTMTGGAGHHAFIGTAVTGVTGTSWEATLSVWFRTEARLNRFWLDR